jgi:hypothetical protein
MQSPFLRQQRIISAGFPNHRSSDLGYHNLGINPRDQALELGAAQTGVSTCRDPACAYRRRLPDALGAATGASDDCLTVVPAAAQDASQALPARMVLDLPQEAFTHAAAACGASGAP